MDFVVLDDLVVARETDGHVRHVVDQVVRGPIADAEKSDPLLVDRVPAGNVMDVVVVRVVPGRRECLAVTAFQVDAPLTSLIDVQPTTPCRVPPLTRIAQLPRLRSVQATIRTPSPPLTTKALPRRLRPAGLGT